jgi:cytochrome c biogenesis protein CcmG/thiol:disulfide interchange protein DsbE
MRRAVIAVLVVLAGCAGPDRAPLGSGGSLVPESRVSLPEYDLETFQRMIEELRGTPVVVNFWGSWCIPCRAEFALFADARRRHADEQLEILGVIYKDSADGASAFMNARGAAWPALVDPGLAVARAYLVVGAPTSYYIDRAGIVRAVSWGPPPADVFEDQLGKIL